MAIAGTWKAQQQVQYATVLKQGTGANPTHRVVGGMGRGIATHETLDTLPPALQDEFMPEDWGYTEEDMALSFGETIVATGIEEYPNWGDDYDRATTQEGWPSAPKKPGLPGGMLIRGVNKGADATNTMNQQQPESLLHDGYKLAGEVEDSVTSDP